MTHRYKVASILREDVEVFSLSEGDFAFAEIAPMLGNNCFSFSLREPVLETVEFPEFAKRPTSYGIPLLFPFPNRIRDGRFSFQGETFTVDPPRHGFVRDKPWVVVGNGASDEDGAWLTSSFDAAFYPEQILRQFPFPFKLEVTYRLRDGRLEMETTVRNAGDREMPVGFGIHPYFRKPNKGFVHVPANGRWELSDSLPTGKILPVEGGYDLHHGQSLYDLNLDDIFTLIESDRNGIARCVLEDQDHATETVVEFPTKQFPHVVVYTPPAPRQAICIEPNSCPTDAFNLQQRGVNSNLIVLAAGGEVRFNLSIYTRPSVIVSPATETN
ncbi:MAG: aldose 1-epimerase [Pyrinomonadaceae bacterium MAG19_C2-C3]|nr:aldose 1-epimerase [Pyrinomonadaceae bacterium MAG19_C2-C3]